MTSPELEPLRLTVTDAGEILTLQRAAYVTEAQLHDDLQMPALTQSLADLEAELADPANAAFGVREEGRLIACLRVSRVDDSTAEVRRIAVAPDRQGLGLGTALLLATEAGLPTEVNDDSALHRRAQRRQPAALPAARLRDHQADAHRPLSPRAHGQAAQREFGQS